jgi:hypothetical protein
MSSAGPARRRRSRGAAHATELDWLCDHGVRIDEKGRIIVSLPIPDDEAEFRDEEHEPSMAELMRRDIDRRHGGSRGRRRRCASKASRCSEPACADRPMQGARLGRPAVGQELRVYVQTTIAPQTRETLTNRGLTLAQVLDDCARELADAF